MEVTGTERVERRPARRSRVVATGLTAAVTVGAVAAIADAEATSDADETGATAGAIAAFEGVVAFDELTAAADPGDPAPVRSPIVGVAGVS